MTYTIWQVAQILKCHEQTVRNMIVDGRLKADKQGSVWRVSEDEVARIKEDKGLK